MSNPESISEELLSAWLDNELSPEERAQVDAELERNEEMRTVLADMEQIRNEIRGLPRHTLSQDFATRIAAACTEPAISVEPPVAAVTATSQSQNWRRIVASLAGVAAAAAAVLLVVWSNTPAGRLVGKTDAKTRTGVESEMAPLANSAVPDLATASDDLAVADEAMDLDLSDAIQPAAGDKLDRARKSQFRLEQGVTRRAFGRNETIKDVNAVVRFDRAALAKERAPVDQREELFSFSVPVETRANANETRLLIEGTRAEIEAAVRDYGKPVSVTLVGQHVDPIRLGLPTEAVATNRVDAFGLDSTLARQSLTLEKSSGFGGAGPETLSMERRSQSPSASPPNANLSTGFGSAAVDSESAREKKLKAALSPDAGIRTTATAAAETPELSGAEPRYRVLFIIPQ